MQMGFAFAQPGLYEHLSGDSRKAVAIGPTGKVPLFRLMMQAFLGKKHRVFCAYSREHSPSTLPTTTCAPRSIRRECY